MVCTTVLGQRSTTQFLAGLDIRTFLSPHCTNPHGGEMEKAKKRLLDDEVGEVVGDPVDVGAFSTLILVLSVLLCSSTRL